MKDMLGRDIVVGDTLAYVSWRAAVMGQSEPYLAFIKVADSSPFALLLVREATESEDEYRTVAEDASRYVICDWAK